MATQTAREVPLSGLPATDDVRLRFSGVTHSEESFEARVFLGPAPAAADPGDPRYVGSFWMYGMGRPAAGQSLPASAPWDVTLPVSRPALAAARRAHSASLSIALVDGDGNPVPPDLLAFQRVAFEATGS